MMCDARKRATLWARGRRATAIMLALSLAACAAPVVFVKETQSFVAAGRSAGTAAGAFFERAQQRQLAANVLLVASDPSCEWSPEIYLRAHYADGASLCVPPGSPGATPYPIRPPAGRGIPAMAEATAALAAYVGELAAMTEAPTPAFAQAVQDAEARVKTLTAALAAAGDGGIENAASASAALTKVTAAAKPALDAATGMADYLAGLAKVADQAEAAQAYVRQNGAAMEAEIGALADWVEIVQVGIVETSGQVARNALITATNRQLRTIPDFARRREMLTQLVASAEEERRIDAGLAATETALRQLRQSHERLRTFASGKPDPVAAAQIRQTQSTIIWDVIGRLGGLAGAIGGL